MTIAKRRSQRGRDRPSRPCPAYPANNLPSECQSADAMRPIRPGPVAVGSPSQSGGVSQTKRENRDHPEIVGNRRALVGPEERAVEDAGDAVLDGIGRRLSARYV